MRQTILGTQIAFSDLNATHAQKREEIKGFRKYIGCPVKVKDYIWGGLITRFDFSGLSDLLITVVMEGGATLCFQASDVYINPLELVFVVGDHSTDPWKVVGVFEVEAAAVRACTTSCHFVGPIQLNKAFPDITDWSNMYYPIAKNPTKVRREALDEIATKIGNAMAERSELLGGHKESHPKAVSNPTFQGVSILKLQGHKCRTPGGDGEIDEVMSAIGGEYRFLVSLSAYCQELFGPADVTLLSRDGTEPPSNWRTPDERV